MQPISFKRHGFPPSVILNTVWLYARVTLSFRDVEEMLAERCLERDGRTVVPEVWSPGREQSSLILPTAEPHLTHYKSAIS